MAAAIKKVIPSAQVELVPGGKGDFIVMADGKLLWNKRAMGGQFPDEGQLVEKLERQSG